MTIRTFSTALLLGGMLIPGVGAVVLTYPGTAAEQPRPHSGPAHGLSAVPAEPVPKTPAAGPIEVSDDPLPVRAVLRLGSNRFHHDASGYGPPMVNWLSFANGGRWLLSTDWSGVYVWEAATGKLVRSIGINWGTQLRSASLSADGQRLATFEHGGGMLQVWNVASGERIRDIAVDARHSFAVLSPDGSLAATWANGSVHLWEIARGRELRTWIADPQGLHCLVFSPDGKSLVSGGRDRIIRVWDVAEGKEQRSLRGHADEVGNLAFSPDGKILVSVGCTVEEYKYDNAFVRVAFASNQMHVWDFDSGKESRQLLVPRPENNGNGKKKYANGIAFLAFSHDGKTLATSLSGATDQAIRLWDMTSGQELAGLGVPQTGCLAFSPDDKLLALGGSRIRLWEVASRAEHVLTREHLGPIHGLAVAPNGRWVASASLDGTLRLWEAGTGKERQRLTIPSGARAVTFAPDGATLLASNKEGGLYLCDVATGQAVGQLESNGMRWCSPPVYSSEGKFLAANDEQGRHYLWNGVTRERLRTWKGEGKPFLGRLGFAADGKLLYSWSEMKVHVWDTATGKELRQFPVGDASHSFTAAFAPNGKWLACGGRERQIYLYDLASGQELPWLEVPGTTTCLTFSPDSRMLAWGGDEGKPILLWELTTHQVRQRLSGHQGRVHALVFWPDSKLLASGSEDGTVLVWDLLDHARLGQNGRRLPLDTLRASWTDLASLDTAAAYAALGKLTASPQEALPILAEHLGAGVPEAKPAMAGRAIPERESPGDSGEPFLRQMLQRGASAKVRQRAQELLEKIEQRNGASDWLRRLRAVEALEVMGTAEARALLQKLADRTPEARIAQEAKASLERLTKRQALP